MNICLVNPRYYMYAEYPPLGLACLGAVIEKKHAVKIIDMGPQKLTYQKVREQIKNADVVGITSMTENFPEALKVARIAKQLNKLVIVGGPHISMRPKEALLNKEIDVGVLGEGEVTFPELLEVIENGSETREIKKIKGIVFKENGNVVVTPQRELIKNLDSLPVPAHHLLPHPRNYFAPQMKKTPLASIITSRGCPFGCVFCSQPVFGRTFRARSPQKVLEEIEYLIEKYRVREIHIVDDTFNADMKRAKEVFRLIIQRNLKIAINLSNGLRIDRVDGELVALMKDAGVYAVNVGIETGDENIMKAIKKGFSLDLAKRNIRLLLRNKLIVSSNFMLGLPNETEQSINETIEFAKNLQTHFSAFQLTTIYEDTPLYRIAKEQNLIGEKKWTGMGYYETKELNINKLRKLRNKAMRKFLLRLSYVLRVLRVVMAYKKIPLMKGAWRVIRMRCFSAASSR